MALDVGVVSINYLPVPSFPVDRFFRHLILDPNAGMGDDEDEYWDGGGNGGNAFYEFTRDGLLNRANGWATVQNISDPERSTLLDWIENLPYRGETDTLILHLSV